MSILLALFHLHPLCGLSFFESVSVYIKFAFLEFG